MATKIPVLFISTHTPLAGCDDPFLTSNFLPFLFQLTHPSRGATKRNISAARDPIISTHTPLAGCDRNILVMSASYIYISTHTPLAGCDKICPGAWGTISAFQLTHPSRGATSVRDGSPTVFIDFNSHTPRGVRQHKEVTHNGKIHFNSHTPRGVRLFISYVIIIL